MWQTLVLSLFLFSLLVSNISPSVNSTVCFFDGHDKSVEEFGGLTVQNCTIINDTNSTTGADDECAVPCDREFRLGSEKEKFELSIGVGKNNSTSIIVLNATISNITFHKLKIRHQNLATGNGEIYWQTIEFNETEIPEKLSVFSSVWEFQRTKIQFFAEGREYKFLKEYHFIPNSTLDTTGNHKIFAYVDTTFEDKVYLHVQPDINIVRYIAEFQRVNEKRLNETLHIPPTFNISVDNLPHEQTNFPENAVYRFSLVPIDKNGTNYTAISVATFCMQTSCETLLQMKLAFGAMAVILILLSVTAWFVLKIKRWRKLNKKPRLLVVYSATHKAHNDVVVKLRNHLKESCEVIPMLDTSDIPLEDHKNPSYWYDSAFQMADIVLVVSSPGWQNSVETESIYKSVDNYAKILIQADRARSKKKYFALLLPYCTESDLPIEATTFDRLRIKDLKKLVHNIYKTKYTEVKQTTPDELELLNSIESARKIIKSEEPISETANLENMTDTAFSKSEETAIDVKRRNISYEDNTASTSWDSSSDEIEYSTKIEDLHLLGNV